MRTIVLMVLVGCSVDDAAIARQICRAGTGPEDVALYDALTATTWFDPAGCGPNGDPLPPTCNRLQLAGDGSYTWTAFSDYPERDQAGSWNLHARAADAGIVCLDDGSVVDVLLASDGLRWGRYGFAPEAPGRRGDGPATLPTIAADPLYVDLTANAWVKTNELDVFRLATSFQLYRDGTFEAAFRDGECLATGTFSVIREWRTPGTHPVMYSRSANSCDLRDGGTPAYVIGDEPRFEDGLLYATGATYREASAASVPHYFAYSSFSRQVGLTVSATWDATLRAGAATSWAMSLRNDGFAPQTVSTLTLDTTPLAVTADGFTAIGPTVTLVDRALGLTIDAGQTVRIADDVVFTPGAAGWTSLRVDVRSADNRQMYRNLEGFLVELR